MINLPDVFLRHNDSRGIFTPEQLCVYFQAAFSQFASDLDEATRAQHHQPAKADILHEPLPPVPVQNDQLEVPRGSPEDGAQGGLNPTKGREQSC